MKVQQELTEANRKIVETMYAAGIKGDFATVMACMAEDIEVHEPAYLPYGGVFKGLEGFQAMLEAISKYADLSTMSVNYLVAEGDRVVANITMKDRITGKDLELFEQSIIRNGKVVEMRIFYFDAGTLIKK